MITSPGTFYLFLPSRPCMLDTPSYATPSPSIRRHAACGTSSVLSKLSSAPGDGATVGGMIHHDGYVAHARVLRMGMFRSLHFTSVLEHLLIQSTGVFDAPGIYIHHLPEPRISFLQ